MATRKTSIDLPEEVWRDAKVWAAFQDKTMGELVTDALTAHLKDLRQRGAIGTQHSGEQMVKKLTGGSVRKKKERGSR